MKWPKGMIFSMQPYADLLYEKIIFIPLYFAFSVAAGSNS
jgi:hypothetical protein